MCHMPCMSLIASVTALAVSQNTDIFSIYQQNFLTPLPKVAKLCIMHGQIISVIYSMSVSCKGNVCCSRMHLHNSACVTHCCLIHERLVTVTII